MRNPTDPPASPGGHDPKKARARHVGLAGFVIGVAGLGFASYALIRAWDELSAADIAPANLSAAAVIGLAGMGMVGLNWIRIIQILGGRPSTRNGFRWYFVGQLGKYIPGSLWAVLGRSELAVRGGIPRPVAYSSVAVSLITTYAAAAGTGAIFMSLGSSSVEDRVLWVVVSLGIVAVAAMGVSKPVVGRINKLTKRLGWQGVLPSASPRTSLSAIILTMPAWLAIGGATAAVAYALGFSPDVPQIIAATCYSWLAGFLVVPLPSGLGVREAAFMALYSGPTQEAAAIAVIARIVFILVDLGGAGLATLASRSRQPVAREL